MKMTLILSLVLMALFFLLLWAAVALVQSKKLFGTAPKDIQEAVLEHEERFPGARLLGWVILVIDVLAFLSVFIYAGWDGIQNDYGFWQFVARFLIMLYLLKAFDIIFFDWFLLTKSHFFQHYYPETEGCAGYHQFGFNRKEQLTKIILFPFAALLLAWICTLF
ncbi:MAG: hypothetical protein NC300_10735 [Bacteroidales bacterium]|nr:hypothetical protein [Clostridium sp.]MCM1204607.1 hypothetical protein [Bacteroidales bacterium]